MKRITNQIMLAGIAAGFLGLCIAQTAKADSCVIYSPAGTTSYVETPYVVNTTPVVYESWPTATQTVVERPMIVKEKVRFTDSHHLIHLGLFPLLNFSMF